MEIKHKISVRQRRVCALGLKMNSMQALGLPGQSSILITRLHHTADDHGDEDR